MFILPSTAQTVPPLDKIQNQEELDRTVTALDAALFDSCTRCDVEKFASFFVDDFEFYHDLGCVTLGKAALTDSVKKNICGKATRELVPGTLHPYYMKAYGALEVGVHRFRHPGHEDTEGGGEGKFIHLWQYKGGAWKIRRVISYDHHAAAKYPAPRVSRTPCPRKSPVQKSGAFFIVPEFHRWQTAQAMEITYELIQKDFTELFAAHRNRRVWAKWTRRIVASLMLLFSALLLFESVRTGNTPTLLPFLVLVAMWLVILAGLPWWWSARRQFLKQPGPRYENSIAR